MVWRSDSGWELIEKSMARGNRVRGASADVAGDHCPATNEDLPKIIAIARRYSKGEHNERFNGLILIVLLGLNGFSGFALATLVAAFS